MITHLKQHKGVCYAKRNQGREDVSGFAEGWLLESVRGQDSSSKDRPFPKDRPAAKEEIDDVLEHEIRRLKQVVQPHDIKLQRSENMAVVDFSSVGSFQVYPTGTYKMRVDGWERNKSSNKGTPQIRFKCSIADGPYAGKPYTEFINITNASAWKAGSFIVGCGVHSSEKIDTESRTFEKMCEACVGRTVYISLTKDDQYNNNKSNSYQEDEEQEPLEFKLGADDAPSFVKGEEVQW